MFPAAVTHAVESPASARTSNPLPGREIPAPLAANPPTTVPANETITFPMRTKER